MENIELVKHFINNVFAPRKLFKRDASIKILILASV